MAVKELIDLYESSPTSSARRTRSPDPSSTSIATLVPTPARFLVRNGPATQGNISTSASSTVTPGEPSASQQAQQAQEEEDVTTLANRPSLPRNHTATRPSAIHFAEVDEKEKLLQHTYPPDTRQHTSRNNRPRIISTNTSSTAGHGSFSSTRSHIPIPATTIFARGAAPLQLPKLDNYIASLPKPEFLENDRGKGKERDESKGKETPGDPAMFPPMERLAKSGLSLDDLESNNVKLPFWKNRKTILGSSLNVVIGFLGSSALASFYSLQGLVNTVQVFALLLGTIVGRDGVGDKWRQIFLGTIPNVLALNFASTLTQSLLYLLAFITITAALLFYFYRSTLHCDRYNTIEGLQQTETNGNQWGLVIVTFLLTVIYLPLSTMAVHVIVWSEELWPIPNPYKNVNATLNADGFPVLEPLGPVEEFRDPLDFCWTTTMKRNEVNYAAVIVILAVVAVAFLTFWFPIALRRVIRQSVPKVDKYNGLGRLRTKADMDAEYHRLLERDRNPFAFLYSGFRRGWATYESIYLFAKLSTLIIIAVIDPDNCLFRHASRINIPIARQVLLLAITIGFFTAQCIFSPFLDPVNNASEWTSRLNYVTTATTALAITLNIPGKEIVDTYVLYSIYIVTYGMGFYFAVINLGIIQRLVKRLTRRIDFSIDIFSPRLDVSPSSIHSRRRIWQESITTLLFTDEGCRIPPEQQMSFSQARDSEYPPYLLDFKGTPGERHAENMKILREVGDMSYQKAVSLLHGPDYSWYQYLEKEIQKHYVGPDSYWRKPGEEEGMSVCKSHFGNSWWIPFPPTLVIRYDEGPLAVLRDISDLETYIAQNSDPDIQRRRQVRMSLRALDGQRVVWPYEHKQRVGRSSWLRRNYAATTSMSYDVCVLRIKRRGFLKWEGLQFGSGFQVELIYSKDVRVTGEVIGLNEDFDLTSPLAKFLEVNRQRIQGRAPYIESVLKSYQRFHRKECKWKNHVMSYRFLAHVYAQPRDPCGLPQSSIEGERDTRIRRLMLHSEDVFSSMYERFTAVSRSEAATWWYIFWDDLWRRNHDTISGLKKHEPDFNPHYKTSIAYTPLPRAALESFLTQRGLLHKKPKFMDCIHSGFLNKLYARLNDCVFRDSNRAIMFHMGHDRNELDMEDVDVMTQGNPSTLGTGGGTNHDGSWIRTRPTYRWEGLLTDPVHAMVRRRSAKAAAPSVDAEKNVAFPKKGRKTYEEPESSSSNEFEQGSSQDGLSNAGDDSEEDMDDVDADAPRFAQWEDDDDLDYDQNEEEEEDSRLVKPKASKLEAQTAQSKDLKSLPLGTLRKAQSALYQAEAETEDEEDSDHDSDSDSESDAEGGTVTKREKVEWTSKETRKKRINKNAPMEVTSKKPVTRKRTVVEVPKIVARDPRFLPMSGDFKPEVFSKSYGFLNDAHKTELQTLKEHLKRARKLLSSSPRDQFEEREAEVERLERALKRAESVVSKDRQDAIRQDALVRAKRQEKEKRKEGKGSWWMKKSEKSELLNKARFEAIAAEGGGRAVKKAIEKKQKKMGQKEKRSRPYAKGAAFDQPSAPRKRFSNAASGEGRPHKKKRYS
ncbi:hypothetical protein MD484_g194, partial [Candolleomyces efflorescens]